MLVYSLRFGQPGSSEFHSYLLVAAFDPNVQQMSVLMMAFSRSTPEPPNRLFLAGAKDEKTAIEEAAKSLLPQLGDPGVVELFALDGSEMKRFIVASDSDLNR
jgi:hypothetical protein